MKIRFCGANRQVTGSCYVLETPGLKVGVDCGMYQERNFLGRNWDAFPFDPGSLDVLLLTHAHLDHCGLLPRLVREGFAGPILSTPPSIEETVSRSAPANMTPRSEGLMGAACILTITSSGPRSGRAVSPSSSRTRPSA